MRNICFVFTITLMQYFTTDTSGNQQTFNAQVDRAAAMEIASNPNILFLVARLIYAYTFTSDTRHSARLPHSSNTVPEV